MKFYRFEEAAKALRVHKRTLYHAVKRLGWRKGPCGWRFSPEDIATLARGAR
jgi:hypothetical protein